MWNGGWMVKPLGSGWGGEGFNFTLDMLCPWHHHENL
jgi:hypothetical protein